MTPVLAQWSDVAVGEYVQAKDGTIYYVQDQRGGALLLRGRDGGYTIHDPVADAPVTKMVPTDLEALNVVSDVLGAEVVGVKEPGKPMVCPPLPRRLDLAHSHMFILHGVWTKSGPGSRSIEKILELHREEHLNPSLRSHAWVDHEHHREQQCASS